MRKERLKIQDGLEARGRDEGNGRYQWREAAKVRQVGSDEQHNDLSRKRLDSTRV